MCETNQKTVGVENPKYTPIYITITIEWPKTSETRRNQKKKKKYDNIEPKYLVDNHNILRNTFSL